MYGNGGITLKGESVLRSSFNYMDTNKNLAKIILCLDRFPEKHSCLTSVRIDLN